MIILGIVIGCVMGIIIGVCIANNKANKNNTEPNIIYQTSHTNTQDLLQKPYTATVSTCSKENQRIKDNILLEMEMGEKYTVSEIVQKLSSYMGITHQKTSGLMSQLHSEQKLHRFENIGKVYFALA